MPCRSPLQGYKNPDGSVTFGERKNSLGRFGLLTFRCGVCRDCRLYRAREWAIRCYHEASLHSESCVLTLTFAKDPGTVRKKDLQLFFKRMRKHGLSFRYFAVGEYGENFTRPHYHVILFGKDFREDRYPWKRSKKGILLYRSPTIEKHWTLGHSDVSDMSMEAAGYCARYTMKKIQGDLADEHYVREFHGVEIPVNPEFMVCSKNPALGLGWIQKYWDEVFPLDHVIYKGKECPVPRYYFRWLLANQPKVAEQVMLKRQQHYEEMEYETGLRLMQAAKARDLKTKRLARNFESDS